MSQFIDSECCVTFYRALVTCGKYVWHAAEKAVMFKKANAFKNQESNNVVLSLSLPFMTGQKGNYIFKVYVSITIHDPCSDIYQWENGLRKNTKLLYNQQPLTETHRCYTKPRLSDPKAQAPSTSADTWLELHFSLVTFCAEQAPLLWRSMQCAVCSTRHPPPLSVFIQRS